MVRIELRVGNRTGAPHGDGRRGHIFAEGEVDEEWPRWFIAGLRQRAVPQQHGPFYLYAGPPGGDLECVWTNAATSPEEVTAVDQKRTSELAAFSTVASAVDARRAELERAEARLADMREQVATTEGRLGRLQQAEEALEKNLVAERQRVSEEKRHLSADVQSARDMARREKEAILGDLLETKKMLREDLTKTVTHITGLGDELMKLERTTAENAMARRSLDYTHVLEKLDLNEKMAEASPSGDVKDKPIDRLANALALTIENGSIVKIVKGVADAVRGEDED